MAARTVSATHWILIVAAVPSNQHRASSNTVTHSVQKEPRMPLLRKAAVAAAVVKPGPSPVAKAAVVGAAVKPGPSPVAKAAVVGAAVKPGPSPIAKAAVVGAVVKPGRRR